MSTPGTSSLISFWRVVRTSLRDFPQSGFTVTKNSLALGGSACSSISARPVRRKNTSTSPFGLAPDFWSARSLASTSLEVALDASSDDPGGSVTPTWTVPSSNGGRKSAPMVVSRHPQYATRSQVRSRSSPARLMLNRTRCPAAHFRARTRNPSRSAWAAFGSASR